MAAPSDVLAAINDLGDNRMSVWARLSEDGITGRPRDCMNCPVAEWLCKRFPGEPVEVGPKTIKVGWVLLPTPPGVTQFVIAFDRQEYPFSKLAWSRLTDEQKAEDIKELEGRNADEARD